MVIHILTILLLLSIFPAPNLFADEEEMFKTYLWSEVRTLESGIRPKIALVLGGGGARGLAHIGVIKVLQQEGIPIDIVVGTSVGALIGSLYVSGYPIEKIERLAEDMGWQKLTNLSLVALVNLISGEKLLSSERMERYISERIGNKRFDELNKPFACISADIQTGEKIVFREGSVANAVRASATIPGVFQPVPYRHRLLVDGGIVDNLPTDVAKMMGADIIIGVTLESDFGEYSTEKVLLVLTQAIYIQGNLLSKDQQQLADIMIIPKLGEISGLDLSRANECIESGAKATRKMVLQIKNLIMERTFDRLFLSKK